MLKLKFNGTHLSIWFEENFISFVWLYVIKNKHQQNKYDDEHVFKAGVELHVV